MRAVLEFELPEDSEEYGMAMHGSKYYSILNHFYNDVLRHKLKYEDLDPKTYAIYEEIRMKLMCIVSDYDIEAPFWKIWDSFLKSILSLKAGLDLPREASVTPHKRL